jgi:hypothetical protein
MHLGLCLRILFLQHLLKMAALEKLLKALETLRVFQAAILADDASAK